MSGTIIGSANGGLTHYWPGWRSEGILEAWVLPLELSGKESAFGLDFLKDQTAEIRAGLIAYDIYEGFEPEFGSHAYKIAGINARDIASRFDWDVLSGDSKDQRENWLVGYTGANEDIVGRLQELAWLRHAFAAGVTPGDLYEWGVDDFTILQLLWWDRRPGETRLSQHIRAIRNGWGLRYLEQSVRDVYRNLLNAVDAGAPKAFLEAYGDELEDVRALQAFFSPKAETLSDDRQAEWAKAFLAAGITKIAPDATGQFSHFLPYSFQNGFLRKPLEPIARYLESVGVGPSDWADFDESWFGR